jgi:adenylylsulfate kinase
MRNLECVAANMAAVGARSLVLAGVVHRRDALALYESTIGVALTIVRLTSPPEIVEARLRGRYVDNDPDALQWHLDRAPELDGILDASPLAMHVVPNTASAIDVARSVLAVWTGSDSVT